MDWELILCIVNEGYSETVMEAARRAGATGGTILDARGTANPELETRFNFSTVPEKEVVMILSGRESVDGILKEVYKAAGLGTNGAGIAFALPVDGTVGLGGNEGESRKASQA